MAVINGLTKKKTPKKSSKNKVSFGKLKLLITIVPRNKTDYYEDLIESLGANMQLVCFGKGTATKEVLSQLAFEFIGNEKTAIFSILNETYVEKAIETLEEKFRTVRNGKGICFVSPLSSIIGASVYNFLADNKEAVKKV